MRPTKTETRAEIVVHFYLSHDGRNLVQLSEARVLKDRILAEHF